MYMGDPSYIFYSVLLPWDLFQEIREYFRMRYHNVMAGVYLKNLPAVAACLGSKAGAEPRLQTMNVR